MRRCAGIDERQSLTSAADPAGPLAYLPARWPPLLYLGFAHVCLALAFAVGAVRPAEIAGFYYHPRLIALVHLVTLGWVSSSILGALYLVGPLTFRVVMPGSWRDVAAFLMWAIGVSGVAAHFWLDTLIGVAWAGVMAMIAMVFVGGRVLRRLPSAPVPIEARLPVMCAVVNILLAALLGVALGVNKTHPFLPVSQLDGVLAHAHLAGLGWGVMMVMGAGYRLLPMMLPSAVPHGAGPIASTVLTQLGAWLLVAARMAAAPPAILTAAALAAAAGVTLFLIQVVWMLRHPRPAPAAQPRPDLGVAHALQALVWLAVSTAFGVWLALAPASGASLAAAMAYGVLALVGFLAQMVVGVAARLVPLYAWLWGFADRAHQSTPPSLHHALSRPVQMVTLGLWTGGVPLLAIALAQDQHVWISMGAATLSVAVILGGANLTLGVWRLWNTGRPAG
jgi:hypothetical protein